MARAVDKEGHRTIGVLTKADMIEDATHNTWLQVLQGTTFPLALGYFCVVNPSQVGLLDMQQQIKLIHWKDVSRAPHE